MWWQEAVVSNWGHSATLRLIPFKPFFFSFSFFFTSFPGYKLHNTTVDKHHFSSLFSPARDTNTPARREVPRVSPTPVSQCSGTENQRETFSFQFHLPALKRCNPVRVTRPCRISTPPTFLFFSPVNWERHHVQKRERDCVARVIYTVAENIRQGQAKQFQHHGQRRCYTLQAWADSALAAGQLPPPSPLPPGWPGVERRPTGPTVCDLRPALPPAPTPAQEWAGRWNKEKTDQRLRRNKQGGKLTRGREGEEEKRREL